MGWRWVLRCHGEGKEEWVVQHHCWPCCALCASWARHVLLFAHYVYDLSLVHAMCVSCLVYVPHVCPVLCMSRVSSVLCTCACMACFVPLMCVPHICRVHATCGPLGSVLPGGA